MTIENARAFMTQSAGDYSLEDAARELQALEPSAALDELVSLGQQYSMPFTREELLAVLKELNTVDQGELNDEQLAGASGGASKPTAIIRGQIPSLVALGKSIAGTLTYMH